MNPQTHNTNLEAAVHPPEDVEYWLMRSPEDRIAEGWALTKLKYGIDGTVRLDKSVFEVVGLSAC